MTDQYGNQPIGSTMDPMGSLEKPALADKHDSGKPMVELVPVGAIMEVAAVLTKGAAKYGANNWRKGLPWTRIYASVLRHLYAWASGEDFDKESGLPHIAHAITNLMFLSTWAKTHPELDDRPRL